MELKSRYVKYFDSRLDTRSYRNTFSVLWIVDMQCGFVFLFRCWTFLEVWLLVLASNQACALPIYFLHIYVYARLVHLRYPAGNREHTYPVDQVSGPTYIMSLPEACISLSLRREGASLL